MTRAVALILVAFALAPGCRRQAPAPATQPAGRTTRDATRAPATRPQRGYKVVHVFVALCDNANQGIVPVPAALGNGQSPASNLYWGAMYGVKTFFKRSREWSALRHATEPNEPAILERVVFRSSRGAAVYVLADAYDGARMKQALTDFLQSAAGRKAVAVRLAGEPAATTLQAGGLADMVCFVGHNGLMDAPLDATPRHAGGANPDCAVVLACKSLSYFAAPLAEANCPILVATTGLMAPEAYTLDAVIRSWAAGETPAQALDAAAAAYARYQKCSRSAARRLFAAGR
ncbi:MAG TPA: hypothetical protein VNA25_02210 [Phycisphaerae bacterium]|nr:hypothetical protein [Phycisphaerae bacterium]